MRPLLLSAGALLVSANTAFAETILWTNESGDNDFANAANWTGGVVPEGSNYASINSVGDERAIFNTAALPNMDGFYVGLDGEGELEVIGGELTATVNSNRISWIGSGSGAVGTVNQSGGTVSINAFQMASAGNTATYNLSGGDFLIARGRPGYSIIIGAGGTASFEISGESSFLTRAVLQLAPSGGNAVFSVVGSSPTEIGIGSHASVDGGWIQGSGGVLKLTIDEGGITKIFINDDDDGVVGGNVTFSPGALIDVDVQGEVLEGSWVVMEWEGVLNDAGLTLSADDAAQGWSFAFEDNGINGDNEGPDTLVLTYDPPVEGEDLVLGSDESLPVGITIGDPSVVSVDGVEGVLTLVGNAIFSDGAVLDLTVVGEPQEGSWPIMEWQGSLINNGLAVDPESAKAGWSIAFEDNGVNSDGVDTLLLTFEVPEILSVDKKFQHPGLMHNKTDLDRVKYNIQAGLEPWTTQFASLAADSFSSYDYSVRGSHEITYLNRENPAVNRYHFENDFTAAYQNALMWYFTEDQRHADKAIEILNAWNNLKHVDGIPLGSGIYGWGMLQSAEIIKNSNAGWKEEDIQKFKDMLVYPGYSATEVPDALNGGEVTFYWKCYVGDRNRAGNQDMSCYMTLMAIGIFMDNEVIYDRGLRYLKGMPHRADDLPYPSGPSRSVALTNETPYQQIFSNEQLNTIEDYGFDGVLTNYILPSGQCMETARDQSHSILGMGFLSRASEMAWIQGDDLYGFADNRLLAGWEYHARYNASYLKAYDDQPEPWEPSVESGEYEIMPSRTARTIGLAPNPWVGEDLTRPSRGSAIIDRHYMEMPLNHYKVRAQLDSDDYKWLERARDLDRELRGDYETKSTNNLGIPSFGTAMFTRLEGMAGDPVGGIDADGMPLLEIPFVPGVIEAENFDYYNQDAGGGEGFTYHDLDEANSGGEYRVNDGVDIEVCSEGGYNLTAMESGEWMNYTVYVPATGEYDLSVRYAAASGDGSIRFSFDGDDVTGDEALPSTGSLSTWATHTVASNVTIEKGVQSMRLYVSGTSNSFALNSIAIELIEDLENPNRIQAEDYDGGRGVEIEESSDVDGGSNLTDIEDGEFTRYDAVYLGASTSVKVRVARAEGTPPSHIELRLTYSSGEPLVSIDVPVTGGLQEWQTVEASFDANLGSANLYVVYHQDDESDKAPLFNLNWIEIHSSAIPSGVATGEVGSDQAEIIWSPTIAATEYQIKRATTSGGPYELIGSAPSSATSFTDTNLTAGVSYFYVVNSIHNGVVGNDSAELQVTPSAPLSEEETVIRVTAGNDGESMVITIPNAVAGHQYVVQKSDSLPASSWENITTPVSGNGEALQITVPLETIESGKYYQLEVSR